MDRKLIKDKLMAAGYPDNAALYPTVVRLDSLTGKPKEMFEHWIATGELLPFEPIEGIDAEMLRTKLDMKDPAIIIAYAMLTDEAQKKESIALFKRLARGQMIFKPNL